MELTNLKFNVDTTALQSAVNLVSVLGDAVQELGRDVQVLATADKNASAAALLQAKARRENALAAKAEVGATQVATKAKKASVEVVEASTKAAKSNVDMLQRQRDIFDFMGQGFSKGQASILATAKATGQLSAELENVLQAQRRLQGGDPFDKSLGAIVRVKNEYAELRDQMRMASAEVELTSKQYRELTRAKLGIIEVMKSQGASFSDIRNKIRELNHEYIQLATVNNRMLAAEKENEKQAKKTANTLIDQAKSTSFLENELIRAERALEGLNNELFVSTSNRILKFEQQLKSSGMTLADQVVMLEKYKKTLTETDRIRTSKGHGSTDQSNRQVELLARSLAPQISDVTVSLAGGMNPFTVLMQQGLQVRDLMQLSGVEAERMGEAFRKAGSGMISTSVAAAGAIGSMLGGVIMDAGKGVTTLVGRVGGLSSKVENLRYNMTLASMAGRTFHEDIKGLVVTQVAAEKSTTALGTAAANFGLKILTAIPIVIGAMTALAVLFAGGLLVGLTQVIKQENELAKVLALNAGNLGISQTAAIGYAQSFDKVSTSTSKVLDVLQAMAKTGSFTRNEFDMVVTSALELQKYGGVAIEDTVKAFNKMKDEPVKALLELAKTTGMVPPAIQEMVMELEQQGKTAEATALSIKTLADVNSQQVTRMKEDLNGFSLFMKELGQDISNFFSGAFKDLFYKADPKKALEKQLTAVNDILNNNAGLIGGIVGGVGLGKDYYEKQRAAISRQILMIDNARQAEENRTASNVKSAKLNELYLKNENEFLTQKEQRLRAVAKAQKENDQLLKAGKITPEQAANRIKEIEDRFKDKKAPGIAKTPEQKSEDSVYNKSLKDLEKIRDAAMKAEVAAMDYSEVQKAAMDIFNDPAFLGYYDKAKKVWVGYTEQQKIALANEIEMLHAQEIAYKAIGAAKKSSEEVVKTRNELVEQAYKDVKAQRDSLDSQKEATNLLTYEASLSGVVSEERQRLLEIKKVELALEKQIAAIREKGGFQVDEQIRLAKANASTQIDNITSKSTNDLNQKLIDGVTDSVMTGLIQGGKAGSKSLRDLIVAELQKPIRVFVQATVSGLMGGAGGSGVGSMLSSAGQFLGLSEGAAGMLGAAGSALSGFAGTAAAGARMAATGGYSTAIGAAGSMGTAGNIAMQAGARGVTGAAGYAAYKGISGGYETNALVDTIGKFAGLFGTTGVVISAIAGGINRAFGRKLTEQGVRANITNGQVSGVENYQFEKGGIFRSDKTTTSAASAGAVSQVTRDAEAIKMQAVGMANALGLNSQAVESYTGALEINYKGAKTAAEQQERYTEGMNNLYASMLQSTGGLDQFKMAGESASQAIQRLTAEALNLASASGYSAETVANTIRDGLLGRMSGSEVGVALGDIMLDSIYNALASGFAEQITASITGMIIQPLMTAVLTGGAISGAVNAASIATVRGQAIATVNAFKQMLADPAIQGLFKEIQSLSTDLGKIIGSAASVTKVKTTSMKRSYSSAATTAQTAADQIKSAWESIFNSLTDQIDKLKNDILGESDIAATYSQAKFNAAIAAAMAGDQDAAKSLPELAQGVIDIAKATVTNLSDLRAVQGATLQQLQTVQQSLSSKYGFAIPAFAVGTNYVQKDMIAQIHEGEAIVPKAYNPAAGGSGTLPSADTQPVTLRLDQLIAILNRIDKSTRELNNNFDNVTEGGNFMRTSVV